MTDNFIVLSAELMMNQSVVARKVYYELLHDYIKKQSDDILAEMFTLVRACIPDFDNQLTQYEDSLSMERPIKYVSQMWQWENKFESGVCQTRDEAELEYAKSCQRNKIKPSMNDLLYVDWNGSEYVIL